MKKTILVILTLATIVLTNGCKKTEDMNPAIANSGTTTGNYIEFKIDGVQYRMDESFTNTSDFVIGAARHNQLDSLYWLSVVFGHSTSDEGATFEIYDSSSITKSAYTIHPYNPAVSTFLEGVFTYIMPTGNQYITTGDVTGTVNFTKIDTVLGQPAEGTFSFNNLELWDEDQDVLSTGHTLTDGKFKTVIR